MKNEHFVVIDDSQAILVMMKSMLAELGYNNVVTSTHPLKALDNIQRHPNKYRAVFTDLNMPEIDGMEVIRRLGQMGYKGGVCIVSELEDRIMELASEIARQHKVCLIGNIAKPISPSHIQRAIKKLIQIEERTFSNYDKMSREELADCIEAGYVTPYYQPKIDIISKHVPSVEVLARICKPGEANAILPGSFINTATEHHMLDMITDQIVDKALTDLPVLQKELGSHLNLGINLSPTQLVNPNFPSKLLETISQRQIDPAKIILEITEEYALKSTTQLECLNRFRIKGFGLSLDDFGTGFTNLHQLRTLPFTEVKIDRNLVSNIHDDRFNQVVVQSLHDICENLPVKLIAEGIEEFEDLDYLESHYQEIIAQGFLICKPRPLDSLLHWYHSWSKGIEAKQA
ncbi:EAL domain-containing response regulator [Vibrio sp. TRT 17S01]|uniref:EAL domain-containing response regulator n=1 Tax=Vibrio sp. TRT 17S01 TaxID=3418505 RepID=UPI003CEA3AEC